MAPKRIIGKFSVLWKKIYMKWQFSISLQAKLTVWAAAVAGPRSFKSTDIHYCVTTLLLLLDQFLFTFIENNRYNKKNNR